MSKRLRSKELERIFIIILDGRRSGSSMADVIMNVSDDLGDLLAIKRERKSSVNDGCDVFDNFCCCCDSFCFRYGECLFSIYGKFWSG